MATIDRKKLEAAVWRSVHADFKGKRDDGTKVVLIFRPSLGTCSEPLSGLTEEELIGKLNRKEREKLFGAPSEAK
jgi:hypothetical protein